MSDSKIKVLIVVEGKKTEPRIMSHLFDCFGISERHQIYSFKSNLYVLYQKMFLKSDPESYDLLQVLKEDAAPEDEWKLDINYSDVLLIFDLDPQDHYYNPDHVLQMLNYFKESSDMGKLYINYPMVESYYHMKTIPDPNYLSYSFPVTNLKSYKKHVGEIRKNNYDSYARTQEECISLIQANITKAKLITGENETGYIPDGDVIFQAMQNVMETRQVVPVLCTCVFYIWEYGHKLLS